MTEWLLDISKRYFNKARVISISRGMLYILFIPVLLVLFALLGARYSDSTSIFGQVFQLIYDLGLAFLCLALMRVVYENGYKMPVIGYYVVVTVIKGVFLFFITSIGTEQGELYTLIFVLSFVLHIIVGVQLLKTKFVKIGKAFLYYVGGIIITAVLSTSEMKGLDSIVLILTCGILAYTFYKELPMYYD